MQRSFLVKEVAATSQDLAAVASAGLAALDALEHGGNTDEAWKAQQSAVVQQASKAKGAIAVDACGGNSKINRRGFGWRQLRCAKTIVQVV